MPAARMADNFKIWVENMASSVACTCSTCHQPNFQGKVVRGNVKFAGEGFFMREGLVYSRRVPAKRDQMAVEQIVLLKECRRTVFHIAHIIPIAGHLGRKKTAEQILRRLYWPTLYWDVADFCQSCEVCQKSIDTHLMHIHGTNDPSTSGDRVIQTSREGHCRTHSLELVGEPLHIGGV